jgi:Ca2+-binding RTX toxin-like protein
MSELIVGAGGFATIQSAVDSASDGDTIIVQAGAYREQVVVDGIDGLTIRAAEGEAVTIIAPTSGLAQTAASFSGVAIYSVVTVKNSLDFALADVVVDGDGQGPQAAAGAGFFGVYLRNSSGSMTDVDLVHVRDPYQAGQTTEGNPIVDGVQRGIGLGVNNDSILPFTMTNGSIVDFQKQATAIFRADIDISGVTVTGGGTQPVVAQNGFSVQQSTGNLSDNIISAIGYSGPAAGTYSGGILAHSNTDLAITGNTITGSNAGSTAGRIEGIAVYQSANVLSGGEISGNVISHADIGIDVSGVHNPNAIRVENNQVTDVDLTDGFAKGVYFLPTTPLTIGFEAEGSEAADLMAGQGGADRLLGLADKDDIRGNGGDDELAGGSGDDRLQGGDGDDLLQGGSGDDRIEGGNGLDGVSYSGAAGGIAIDLLSTGPQDSGGAGFDELTGIENVVGSAFADSLRGSAGDNRIDGGGGRDLLFGRGGNDRLFGDGGDDVLAGGAGDDKLHGGLGDDVFLVGDAGDEAIEGFEGGRDLVRAEIDFTIGDNIENLRLIGRAATGTGNALDNWIVGNDGNNILYGLDGSDDTRGQRGSDEIHGGDGDDRSYGGLGDDVIYGDAGNDRLTGEGGDDDVRGGADDDALYGRGGADALNGGEGDDRLIGGSGVDRITGGTGLDVFAFDKGDSGATRVLADIITDFSHEEGDRIHLALIDANTATAGDQSFQFIGESDFTGNSAELRSEIFQGNTYLSGDLDGDRAADFFIRIDGTGPVVLTDLVL